MLPAAVLSVVVNAEGVGPTNAQLNTVQSTLKKTAAVADTAGTSIVTSGKRIEKAGTGIGRFGRAATKYYATPMLAAAGASVYFANKFEKSMLLVQTHTDTSKKNLELYKRSILEMSSSGKFIQGPTELGEAMYHIASDGYKGAKALEILRQSANLAEIGQSNMAETTYAVVSAVKNQIKGAMDAKEAIANLNAIMGAGDTKMQEVTGSMSTGIIPAAKQMGLSFEDVGAALDLLTQRGVPAQQGAYRLAMTFQMLIPHTEKAEAAFERLGLSNMDLIHAIEANPKHGLLSAMELLEDHLRKIDGMKPANQIQDIEEIFGGGRTSRGAISMLQNLPQLADTYERINKLAGETPKKIKEAKAADVNKLKAAWVQLETVLTKLGMVLLPMVVAGISSIVHWLQTALDWFLKLPHGTQMWIIKILALTIALAFLIRIVGFFVKSAGMAVQWVGALIDAFAGNTAAAAEVAAANETVAASYMQLTDAAIAASGAVESFAVTESGLAVPASAAARAGAGAATGEVAAAGEAAGGSAAMGLAGGMAAMLPAAIAAVGLGNILSSALGGDTKGAAFKSGGAIGGAIIGGILGSVIPGAGTVAGALVGGGIGSIAGGLIGHLFGGDSGPKMTRYQEQVKKTSEVAAAAFRRQRAAGKALEHNEHSLAAAKKHSHSMDGQVEAAQHKLTQAIKRFGASSSQAAHAQHHLNRVKIESIAADRKLANAEKLHGVLRTATIRSDKTAIAAAKEKKQALHEEIGQLVKRLRIVESEPDTEQRAQKEKTKVNEIHDATKKLNQVREEESRIVKEAAQQIGPKFAHYLEKISPQLYKIKTSAHAAGMGVKEYQQHIYGLMTGGGQDIQTIIDHYKHMNEATQKAGREVAGPFKTKTQEGFEHAAKSAKHMEETATTAIGNVGTSMNSMLTQMGNSPLSFSASKGKGHKKQRGGPITIGAAVGDSVHTVLEKGEYVMNREAVSKIGVHKLNDINFGKAPRFMQEGGPVGDLGAAIAAANAINAHHFPYVWGGGHGSFGGPYDCSGAVSAVLHAAGLLNRPMVSGELANYGKPGPGPITIYANAEHAFMKLGGKFFGTSGANPGGGAGWFPSSVGMGEVREGDAAGPFQVRHPDGVAGGSIARTIIKGANGQLKQIAQGSVDIVTNAANKYIQSKMGGAFGGGNSAFGPGKIVGASTYHPDAFTGTVGSSGESLLGKMAFAELNMGHALGDLPYHTKLKISRAGRSVIGEKLDIGAGGGPVEGHPRDIDLWYQTANALGLPSDWLGLVGLSKAQKGGHVKGGKHGIEKEIKSTLHGLGAGKHLPKFQSHLKKIGRRIDKMGLPASRMGRLGDLSKAVERYSEYASNASSLTKQGEDGTITQGMFKGANEGSWLQKELDSLIALRMQVIGAHEVVMTKILPRVMKLLDHTRQRLRKAQADIRHDERVKRELEKKIRDMEKAQNDQVKKLEKEKKDIERRVNQAQQAKHPNQQAIQAMQAEIKSKNDAIGATNQEAANVIKHDHQKIRELDKDVHAKQRIESGAQTLIGKLGDKRTALYSAASALYGSGGEFEGTGNSFIGLQQIQGSGGTTEAIPNPPELGSVGGEIFQVQLRLQEIKEELERKPTPSGSGADELKELEKEIDLEWKKRYMVSQYQLGVLRGFPSASAVAAVPYAGGFAVGGAVVARVGERGAEYAVMPHGSHVLTEPDAKRAIAAGGGGGNTTVVIDELVINEDGSAQIRTGDKVSEAHVKKVTRKQSRRSSAITPGGLS